MELHPNDQDMINFALDELRQRKKDRILAHCRECPDCADRLIAATREHAPDPGPMRLTRWNKIWLGALVVSILALVATLVILLRSMQPPEPMLPPTNGEAQEQVPQPR